MSGDNEAESLFSERAEMCEVHTVVRCWSTHNKCETALGPCGDAEGDVGHCAAQGDAVGRLQCLLGDASRCEGAKSHFNPSRHQHAGTWHSTLLCGGNSTMGESKARDPLVE